MQFHSHRPASKSEARSSDPGLEAIARLHSCPSSFLATRCKSFTCPPSPPRTLIGDEIEDRVTGATQVRTSGNSKIKLGNSWICDLYVTYIDDEKVPRIMELTNN